MDYGDCYCSHPDTKKSEIGSKKKASCCNDWGV